MPVIQPLVLDKNQLRNEIRVCKRPSYLNIWLSRSSHVTLAKSNAVSNAVRLSRPEGAVGIIWVYIGIM